MTWEKEALYELEQIPEHVRHMAKSAIEKHVKKKDFATITNKDVLEIKEKYFSMLDKDEGSVNIAIVRCDIISEVCPGSGCLKAFDKRKIHFEQYGPEAKLIGFFTCGGCSGRRVARLVGKLKSNNDLDIVHLASCMLFEGKEHPKCVFKDAIQESIEEKEIKVVRGTHH